MRKAWIMELGPNLGLTTYLLVWLRETFLSLCSSILSFAKDYNSIYYSVLWEWNHLVYVKILARNKVSLPKMFVPFFLRVLTQIKVHSPPLSNCGERNFILKMMLTLVDIICRKLLYAENWPEHDTWNLSVNLRKI